MDKSTTTADPTDVNPERASADAAGAVQCTANVRLLGGALQEVEIQTLKEMAAHHPYPDFRRRALGLLALDKGYRVVDICQILQVSDQPLYNWAKGWRQQGLVGILTGHKGGAPRKLTDALLDEAVQIAKDEPLTLGQIAQQLHQRHPDAPSFSLDRLSVGLRLRGLSYKRGRKTLKKSAMPASTSA